MTKKYLKHFFFGGSVSYPHALHSRHGPEGPEGPQGSHCPEGLDPSSAKQGGSEVDERDLGLLVGYCYSHVIGYLRSCIYCQCYGVSKACWCGSGRRVNS